MTMARKHVINSTWAPVDPRVVGGGRSVKTLHVNIRHALGLAVVEHGGGFGLGAVFSFSPNDEGELAVIPLDLGGGLSLIDANQALDDLAAEASEPAKELQD